MTLHSQLENLSRDSGYTLPSPFLYSKATVLRVCLHKQRQTDLIKVGLTQPCHWLNSWFRRRHWEKMLICGFVTKKKKKFALHSGVPRARRGCWHNLVSYWWMWGEALWNPTEQGGVWTLWFGGVGENDTARGVQTPNHQGACVFTSGFLILSRKLGSDVLSSVLEGGHE